MNVKLLTEHNVEFLGLKGGCTGSSKSTNVKMTHCWKSHVAAYILFLNSHLNHKHKLILISEVSQRCLNSLHINALIETLPLKPNK